MPAPREEAMLPSDALVIKQVLDSMVANIVQSCQPSQVLVLCAICMYLTRGALHLNVRAGHQRVRASSRSSAARLYVQKCCRSFAGCRGKHLAATQHHTGNKHHGRNQVLAGLSKRQNQSSALVFQQGLP